VVLLTGLDLLDVKVSGLFYIYLKRIAIIYAYSTYGKGKSPSKKGCWKVKVSIVFIDVLEV